MIRTVHDRAIVLGRDVRAARLRSNRSQRSVGREAGVDPSVVSRIELGRGGNVALSTWSAVAEAVGLRLGSFGGDHPDHRLPFHRSVAELAVRGGWNGAVSADETILTRVEERAVVHVWHTVTAAEPDVTRFRESLERERASGIVIIPATTDNRRRVSELRSLLREAFPGRGNAWYAALVSRSRSMPADPGILWAFPDGERLRPATVLPGWAWTTPDHASRALRRSAG